MTVLAVEAAEGVGARATAGRTAAKRKAAGRRAKPGAARTPTPSEVAQRRVAQRERNAQIRAEERRIGPGPAVQAEQDQAQRDRRRRQTTRRAQSIGRDVGRSAASASIPGDRSYQPVILAEFLIAVVLVAFTPIATGGSPNAKAKGSPSPYDVGDLRQLVAVGAVYFVLSLISSGNRGRISAWLGGLIVIGIGMTKLSKGQLGSLVQGITGTAPSAAEESGGSADTATGGGGSKNPEAA